MKKLIVFITVIALLLTGCTTANTDTRIFETLHSEYKYSIIRDTETGVEYIVYKTEGEGGITPRLDADGNVVVLHKAEQE